MGQVDWFLSSREFDSDPAVTIDASLEAVAIAAGGAYLEHTTAALSLLQQFVIAMTSAGVAAAAAVITKGRRVKLTSSGVFTVTWTDTALRDLLGFTGNLAGDDEYVATNQSTLLWSSGRPYSPTMAVLDAIAVPTVDASVTVGPRGVQTVREHGLPTKRNSWDFRRVAKARFWEDPLTNPDGVAGDFRHFWANEMWTSQKLVLLRHVTEGADGDTTTAEYGASHVLGPYVADLASAKSKRFEMRRVLPNVEKYYDIDIDVIQTEEFAA